MSAQLDVIPNCSGGHEPQNEEFSYWVDENQNACIKGVIPANLTGTFFRNGPGRLKLDKDKFGHWFDGDGMLCAFTFQNGRVHFKNRFVRTPKYVKESQTGRIEYRGFGTQRPGGILANILRPPANPANTNSVYHGGLLLALNEGGKPYSLDPSNLHTYGEYTYDGELTPAMVFSAHGKIDPTSGDYYNFGAGLDFGRSGAKAKINTYRVSAEGKMVSKGAIKLETFPFCHDFVITGRYGIYFINSIVTEGIMDVILGRATIADCISYKKDQPMQVIVVDLATHEEVQRFVTDDGAIIHFGNAWQMGNELIVDGMYADNFDANEGLKDVTSIENFAGGKYRRYFLNLNNGKIRWESVTDTESEFPTFNPLLVGRQNDLTFTACSVDNGHASFYNAIQSTNQAGDQNLVTLEPGYYGSEPLFALASDSNEEEDGYVLELIYNAFSHCTELHILEAADIKNTIACVKLPHHIPHQFHGFFTREILLKP